MIPDGQWSYDDENHWLVFTENAGASAIIAFDVQPQWAARLLAALAHDLLSGSTSSASADAEVSDPEAVGLDVERLARAMARCAEVGPPAHINPDDAEEHWPSYVAEAEEYAREYAALTEAKPESPA
jgi:hypothetical protein